MKVTIEIWQSKFNDEWNCNITTTKDEQPATEYWAVEDFCELLNLIGDRFPKAKIIKNTDDKAIE